MFKLKERNLKPLTETNAGLTTFFSMVYVLAVNPIILSAAGMPKEAVFTATALGAVVGTLLMAVIANLPFAVAPAMGINAFFVVVVTTLGYSWPQALTAVFVSGILFVLLSLSPLRERVLREVPHSLQYAVCGGVGIMLASIGLINSGVIVFKQGMPALGMLSSGAPFLVIIGLFVTSALLALKIRFALLAGIFISTLIGIPLGVSDTTALSQGVFTVPPDLSPIAFKFDFSVLASLDFWGIVMAFLFMEVIVGLAGFLSLFSVMGAEGEQYRPKMGRAFVADSLGVVFGSLIGLSPTTVYGESGAGVAAGGRSGLTAWVVAGCFLLALFASPLFLVVPFAAVAPALTVVGWLMLSSVVKINFQDQCEAFPATVALIFIALSWQIADGLALGWLIYITMKIFAGRKSEIKATVWVLGFIFTTKMFF
ncbi:MAG: NCS2 family permease [Candidatus Adiutrix sp.]